LQLDHLAQAGDAHRLPRLPQLPEGGGAVARRHAGAVAGSWLMGHGYKRAGPSDTRLLEGSRAFLRVRHAALSQIF
jgi:hypothetical protein